ncbi:exported hypothetical protein [Nostocoides japonicum T1-X7]|uniref:Uncharacterized protein n=2 Tax=Nostocoides japonicum TaxID=99481 RepID=A0A077M1R7_9MICO|nr:exported hypothetical protein [Tetrasphaera japonica T1-X7]
MSRAQALKGVAVTAAVVALPIAGCSSPTDGATAPSSTATSTTSPSPSASEAAATADPRVAAAAAANVKLTDALYKLTEALKKAETDNKLAEPRKRMADATSNARSLVKKQRFAAYKTSPRNCATVRSLGSQARSATVGIASARSDIEHQVATLRLDLASVDVAAKRVSTDRAQLTAALKGLGTPPPTVSSADVSAALADAAQRRKDIQSAVSAVSAASADAQKVSGTIAGQAYQIIAKACPG